MADLFGRYESQTTKALRQIDSSKYPDTNKDVEANLVRINQFIDYISQYLQTMQKGVDAANKDPLSQMRDTIWNLGALLGGGELLYGIDLGDLQYYLPALGAMFGFDSDTPFPINLFEAVEHFFLGYVVPLDSFTVVIQDLIDGWLIALGIDPDTVQAIHELLDAIGAVSSDVFDLFEQLQGMLDILGISLDGLGPFGDIWHSITQILGGLNLETLGNLVDPVLSALAPWLHELAVMIGYLDQIIKAFSGGITDLNGILNFAGMFTPFVDLLAGFTTPLAAWSELFSNAILPDIGGVGGLPFFGNLAQLLPGLDNSGGAFDPQAIWNTVAGTFLGALASAVQQFIPDWIPLASIVDDLVNLLPDGLFSSASSVGAGPWDWTDLFSTGDSTGSATIDHDGSLFTLFSDPPTKVKEGQNLDLTQAIRWEDIGSVTGTAFSLGVQLFNTAMQPIGGIIPVADVVNPLNSSSAEPDSNADDFVNIGAGYTVPAGASYLSQVLTINPIVTMGQSWWSDGSLTRDSLMPMSFVSGLPEQITSLLARAQDIIDTLAQAVFGGLGTGYFLQDLKDAFSNFPGVNVGGAGGMPNIVTTVTTMWDAVTSALRLVPGLSNVNLASLAGAAQDTSMQAGNAEQLAVSQTNILNNRTSNPVGGLLERTTVSNLRLADLGSGATPTTIAVTQAASAMGFVRMPNADTKGTFFFWSSGNANVTGFYINFGRMALDGTVTPIFSTPNIVAQLTAAGDFRQYTFPGVSKFTHNMSEVIVAEFQVVGSGTVNVAGTPQGTWMTTNHPTATTKRPGGSRNTGATNAANSLNLSAATMNGLFSGNTPMVGIGRSDVPVSYVPPDVQKFTTTGTYTRPGWMVDGDLLDVFLFPAGGGGESGGYGAPGEGGTAGISVTRQYVVGSDPRGTGLPIIPLSTTLFTHTLGAAGTGGVNPFALDPGNNAANSTVSAAGITTLTGTGGIGGGRSGNNWNQTIGQHATNRTVADYTEWGGTDAAVNADGVFPGGGGGSGYPAFGHNGAGAQVTYRARQGS